MKIKPLPARAELLAAFRYDRKSGVLTWRYRSDVPKRTNSNFAGKVAGWSEGGHMAVGFRRRVYILHRIIWKMIRGTEPVVVDHRDCNPFNNRWRNLRAADFVTNNWNRRQAPGRRLPKWVFVDKLYPDRFRACIKAHGKNHYISAKPTPLAAHRAASALAKKLHGEFRRAA